VVDRSVRRRVARAGATGVCGTGVQQRRRPRAVRFALDGFVATAAGSTTAAAVGRFVADGAGTIYNGVRTLVVGGAATHQTFRCTYSVAPNGTGTATCEVMTGGVVTGTEHYDFVIVDNGEEAFFTETDPGVTIRGSAERQRSK